MFFFLQSRGNDSIMERTVQNNIACEQNSSNKFGNIFNIKLNCFKSVPLTN